MKTLFLLILLSFAAFGQTSTYPGAIDNDASLFVTADNVQSTLSVAATAGDATITVSSGAGFVANMIVTICDTITSTGKCTVYEHMKVTNVAGGVLTVTRGVGGTSARAHSAGKLVSVLWDKVHHDALKSGLIAVQTALGPNLSSIADFRTTRYDFTPQTPGGSLIAGGIGQAITLTPCPGGVNGTDTGHYVYLSGGTGTAETVLITGGTCTSGAASGTITVTPADNHSGAWTVGPASFGWQEAIQAAQTAGGGTVVIPPGSYTLRATVRITASNITVEGAGVDGTSITRTGDFGDSIYVNGGAGGVTNVQVKGIALEHTINYAEGPPPTVTNKPTNGAHVRVLNCKWCSVEENRLFNMPYGIVLDTVGWTAARANTIKSVWDASNATVQIGVAGIYLTHSQTGYGYPTYAWVEDNVITGYQSAARTVTVNGNNILNHFDPTGPRYGMLVESCEVCWLRNNTMEYCNDSGIGIVAPAPDGVSDALLAIEINGNYIDYNRLYGIKFDMSADEANRYALGTRIYDNWILGSGASLNGIYFESATTPANYVRTAHETSITNNVIRLTLGSGIYMLSGGKTTISGNTIDSYNALDSYPTNSFSCAGTPCTGDRRGNSAVYAAQAVTNLSVTPNHLGGNYTGNRYGTGSTYTMNGVALGTLLFQSATTEGSVIVAPNVDGGVQPPASRSPAVAYDPGFFTPQGPISNPGLSTLTLVGCGALDAKSTIQSGKVTSSTSGACAIQLNIGGGSEAKNGWACSMQNITTPGGTNAMYQSVSAINAVGFTGTTVSGDTLLYQCTAY